MNENLLKKSDIVFVTILYIMVIVIFVLLVITISNQKEVVKESLDNTSDSVSSIKK